MSFHSNGIELSDEARDDLADISAHGFEEWGETDSLRYFTELLQAFERIEEFPSIGQRFGDAQTRLRRLTFKSHVIYYRLNETGSAVEIVRVLHARMDNVRHLGMS